MEKDVQVIPYKVLSLEPIPTEYIPDGVHMAKATEQWLKGNTGEGVVVAVIDTGIDYDHPDLIDNIIGGKDFTGGNDYMDRNGHGTHVAGVIAASNSGNGIVGMAPNAKLLALKALADDGVGDIGWTLAALRYAIDQDVDVINMSIGGPDTPKLRALVQEAYNKGIIIVAASGNEGDGDEETLEYSYPGAYPEVIQVGAVDMFNKTAYFSNTNDEVDVLALGVEVLSTFPDNTYARIDGTSMAAPHVAGAAALILSMDLNDYTSGPGSRMLDLSAKSIPVLPDPDVEELPVTPSAPDTVFSIFRAIWQLLKRLFTQ